MASSSAIKTTEQTVKSMQQKRGRGILFGYVRGGNPHPADVHNTCTYVQLLI